MPRRIFVLFALLFALSSSNALATEAEGSYYFVPVESRAALALLQDAGFDVLWRTRQGVWLRADDSDAARLVGLGFAPRYWPNSPVLPNAKARKANAYHDNDGVKTVLDQISANYPSITKRFTLGKSVQGRDLHGLVISKNPTQEWAVPQIRLVGSHHGDEYMSVEIPLLMAQYLTSQYATNSRVKALVDGNRFVVVPLLNPDGHALEQRENANGVDLNRTYGYEYHNNRTGDSSTNVFSPFAEPEVRALADDHFLRNYTLSYSFHTFADVVNYLWNYTTLTYPDEPLVKSISERYASLSGYEATNGFDWYQTYGDLNDFSYGTSGDFDTTIELVAPDPDQSWLPKDQTIAEVWNENREALLDAFEQTAKGLSGVARDRKTGAPVRAYLLCDELFWPVYSGRTDGYFKRLLLPGDYTCKVVAPGYDTVSLGKRTILDEAPVFVGDVLMTPTPGTHVYAFQVMTVSTDGENTSYSPALLGAPDGKGYSLYRQGGLAVVDMGVAMSLDDAHAIRVSLSASTSGASYVLYVGSDYVGPWTSVGQAVGTNDFNLIGLGVQSARYVKIVAGSNSGDSYPSIDAVEYRQLTPLPDGDGEVESETEAEAESEIEADNEPESETESELLEGDTEREAEPRVDGDRETETTEQELAEGEGEAETQAPDGDQEKVIGEEDEDSAEADSDSDAEVIVPREGGSSGGCATTQAPAGWALLLLFGACWRLKRRRT